MGRQIGKNLYEALGVELDELCILIHAQIGENDNLFGQGSLMRLRRFAPPCTMQHLLPAS